MQEVMEPILQIQVLGKFTLRYGETVISDEDDRSRKVWAVLAYLIYHREKIISQQELVDLCWGEDTRSSDPHNALKSVIHRIRATLDKLQEGLGRTLLRRKAGCYIWNTDVPLEVDAEVFDTLCSCGAALEGDERLDAYQQALALYSNDILPKLSSELWLVPITTYYHQRCPDRRGEHPALGGAGPLAGSHSPGPAGRTHRTLSGEAIRPAHPHAAQDGEPKGGHRRV